MKYLPSQISYYFGDRQIRQNLKALRPYLLLLLGVILVHSILFHFVMEYAEGQHHSWLTGLYWTLTVMSTLGFGDITFHTDTGRLFSIAVLLSGVVLLLIMLPFAFIRFFYAPWLEARIRQQAPRQAPEGIEGHVIICRYDSIAPGLMRKLSFNSIPYIVVEPDPIVAANMSIDEISVVTGEVDNRVTYERLRVTNARMVLANAEDTTNTNITLTVREADREVPIIALAEDVDSVDILGLSGARHVLPLKQTLGEYLAARISGGPGSAYVVGRYRDLCIAEFNVHNTALAGRTVGETRLPERTGMEIVGVWEGGHLRPAHSELKLSDAAVPVTIGSQTDLSRLSDLLGAAGAPVRPVLVIGGGKVGRATAAALKQRGVPVHCVEKDERLRKILEKTVDRVVIGDAADREVLREAGLEKAGAVALTSNEDAVNIHLTVYCRRLSPDLIIASRITHERNVEAIYRAGADSVLSYASLGQESIISLVLGREPIMVGEGAEFFEVRVPASLAGSSLGEAQIEPRTGLIVIAVVDGEGSHPAPPPSTGLALDSRILMLGTTEQRQRFSTEFA